MSSDNLTDATQGESLRVLFVEDSEFDCDMIKRLLAHTGFVLDSRRVEDETGMRAALADGRWDAIISDHNLPHFDATAALAVFKEVQLDAPFIIVSGAIGEDLAVEAMLNGADDYVLKSRLARLAPALRRGLVAAEARRQRRSAEQALHASEARLRGITSSFPGFILRLVRERAGGAWKFEHIGEGAERLLGVRAATIEGDPERFLDLLEGGDKVQFDEALAATPEGADEARWQGRYRPAGQQGAWRWIEFACAVRERSPEVLLWEGVAIDITSQKRAEAALEESRTQLRELSTHFERVKEEERKALARELHDDVGGILASMKLELAMLQNGAGRTEAAGHLDSALALLDSAREASDRMMRNLRPSILDQGIVEALGWLTRDFGKRHGIDCSFRTNREDVELDEDHCMALFRVCQESLMNVAKHARARSARVDFFVSEDLITLEIADDGTGIAPERAQARERFGIRGMRERVENLGGWLEIGGKPDLGTSVMIGLPGSGA
jgi:two-component system sensor histidine kinase UhpB